MTTISVTIEGIDATLASLSAGARQLPFAIARALTVTAHAVNAEVKRELSTNIQGGPTSYTLRAFKVHAATVAAPTATVELRTDAPEGGTPYDQSIAHLFHGGVRRFKRLEGLLREQGLIPAGMQIAPGGKLPIDRRGNPKLNDLKEMLGILGSGIRNLQSYRRSGRSKVTKAIGFFVVLPGSVAARRLHIGIWRRIQSGQGSVIEPWFMFVSPPPYQQRFDLDKTARTVVQAVWQKNFADSLAKALATAQ